MGMKWKCIASLECSAKIEQFRYAIDIYNKRPHIINRKLMGAEFLLSFQLDNSSLVKSVLSKLKYLGQSSSAVIIKSMQSIEGLQILNAERIEQCDLLHFALRNLLPRNNNLLPQLELTVQGMYEPIMWA